MAKQSKAKPRQLKGFEPAVQAELQEAWEVADGLPTVMESGKVAAVIRTQLEGQPMQTALVVGVSEDGQKAFGMLDNGAGIVKVEVFDLSSMGFPNALVKVVPYTGKFGVWEAYWKATEGHDYVEPLEE